MHRGGSVVATGFEIGLFLDAHGTTGPFMTIQSI